MISLILISISYLLLDVGVQANIDAVNSEEENEVHTLTSQLKDTTLFYILSDVEKDVLDVEILIDGISYLVDKNSELDKEYEVSLEYVLKEYDNATIEVIAGDAQNRLVKNTHYYQNESKSENDLNTQEPENEDETEKELVGELEEEKPLLNEDTIDVDKNHDNNEKEDTINNVLPQMNSLENQFFKLVGFVLLISSILLGFISIKKEKTK